MHKYAFFNFKSQIDFDVYKNVTILILSIILTLPIFFLYNIYNVLKILTRKFLEIIWLNFKKSPKYCVFVKKTNFCIHYMQIYAKIYNISIFCKILLKYANAYFPSKKLEKLALLITIYFPIDSTVPRDVN